MNYTKFILLLFISIIAPALSAADEPVLPDAATAPPAEHGAPPADPQRNIRFQFDGVPYMDVLERFAQMVNKPLVTNAKIEGTLTFNDPRPYSYPEALDTLNVILAMKNLMLIETDRYLRLVEFKDLAQMPLKIVRGTNELGDVRPGEIVTVVLTLQNLESSDILEGIKPLLSNAGSVAPLSRGRGLIITDRLAQIQRIRQLIDQVDTASPVQRQMKAYTLIHSSGAVLSDLINKTFGSATAPVRTRYDEQRKQFQTLPPDPNDYVTAVFDEASRTLVLYGPNERVLLAEELIAKFEDKENSGASEVKILYPKTEVTELARMVRQAIPGVAAENESGSNASTKARLIVDAPANRLIVAAPVAGQLASIEEFVSTVDEDAGGPTLPSQSIELTKVFQLQFADPNVITRILTESLRDDSNPARRNAGPRITADPAAKAVVVTGSPGDIQRAVDIVSQLDASRNNVGPQETEFIQLLDVEELNRILPLAKQLYQDQFSAPDVAHAKIMADPETSRLIITANPEHLVKIREIVTQLRTASADPQPRELRIFTLQNTQVDQIAKTLSDLVTEKMSDPRFKNQPQPYLIPDPAHRRFLVTASAAQHAEVEALIQTLDLAPQRVQTEINFIPLAGQSAKELIPLLTQLLAQLRDPASQAPAPKVIADASDRQLIVTATPDDLAEIQTLVEQLEGTNEAPAPRMLQAIQLRGHTAQELLPLVQSLYQEQIRYLTPPPSGGPATVIQGTVANELIISGSQREIARVETIVLQLDPPTRAAAKEETRVVRLRSGVASELADLVQKTLGAQRSEAKVLVDDRSNSLVITGPEESVRAAANLVDQLDVGTERPQREMRIFQLQSSQNAAALLPLLNEALTEWFRTQRGAGFISTVKIVPDHAGNRLIASGPKDELEQVALLLTKLDVAPEPPSGARVFPLNTASARELAQIISQTMASTDPRYRGQPRVTVAADEKTNSLVVSGDNADLEEVALIVKNLDGPAQPKGRLLKVFELKNTEAAAVIQAAQPIFASKSFANGLNEISLSADPAGRRIIALVPPALIQDVEMLIAALDQSPDQPSRALKLIDLEQTATPDLLNAITRIYGEQFPDSRIRPPTMFLSNGNRALAILGSAEQHESVQQIVATLQTPTDQENRTTKIFPFENAQELQRLLPIVQQLYRDQATSTSGSAQTDAQFLSDDKNGRLIVSARPSDLPLIEQIVLQLRANEPTSSERQTRIFEVGRPEEVKRLLPLVQQLYQDQWKDKQPHDPADAQFLGDAPTGRLIITGKPAHLEQIATLIQQLGGSPVVPANHETRVYELKSSRAPDLVQTVQTLYGEHIKNNPPADSPALILADPSTNRLIVSGPADQLGAIENIIQKLDTATAQTAGTRVFKLKSSQATEVANLLSQTLVEFNPSGRQVPKVSVGADSKSNTLIVSGQPDALQSAGLIIEQLDTIAPGENRKLNIIPLQSSAIASQLASRVQTIYADQMRGRPEAGTADAVILGDDNARVLIVTANARQLELIQEIITKLEANQPEPAPRESRIFQVGAASEVERLTPLLQQLYREHLRGQESAAPADAQLLADTSKGQIVATGRPEHLDLIESLMAQLKSEPPSADEQRSTRVYDLQSARAPELAQTVRTLYQEQTRQLPPSSSPALILADEATNRLIVSGLLKDLELIESIINPLDQASAQTAGTRVFKLRSSEATQLAAILSSALTQPGRGGQAIPRISVGADPKSNTLIVSGEPDALQAAAVIVDQLDSIESREQRHVRIIPLTSGIAAELATQVRQVYLDQMKGLPDAGAADALILGDNFSNRLIITAAETQLELVEKIVQQFQAGGQGAHRQLRFFMLKHNSAASLASVIAQLYNRELQSPDPSQRLTITPAPDDQTLIVDAAPPILDQIDKLITGLDTEPARTHLEVRVYRLGDANAGQLASVFANLFQERYGGRRTPDALRMQPRFGADPISNTLLVAASRDQFTQIEELISELQAPVEVATQTRTFNLKHAEPNQTSAVLESLLNETSSSSYRGYRSWRDRYSSGTSDQARVIPAPFINAIIVQANPEKLATAETLIQTLDQPHPANAVMQTVHLTKGDAEAIAQAINTALDARIQTAQSSTRPKVTAVPGSNSVLINGPTNEVESIIQLIHELDQRNPGSGSEFRLYPVTHADAEELARVLSPILQNLARRQTFNRRSRQDLSLSISADERTNTLIVSGTPEYFAMVEQLLASLDKAPERSDRQVRFVWLESADAVEVAAKLDAVFQDRTGEDQVIVEPDPFSNSLTIVAKRADLIEIENIISQLDASVRNDNLQVRFITTGDIPAEQLAKMLQNIYSQMSRTEIQIVDRIPDENKPAPTNNLPSTNQAPATPDAAVDAPPVPVVIAIDKTANALIISGPAHDLDEIDTLVFDLTFTSLGTDTEVRQFVLEEADPVAVAKTLGELFKQEPIKVEQKQGEAPKVLQPPPKITVVAEPRTRSIIVRAKPTEFAVLESLLEQLDARGIDAQLESRIITLAHAQPEKVLPLVSQLVSQITSVRPGDPIAVTASPRDRAILAIGRRTILDEINDLVTRLDSPTEHSTVQTQIVPLENASAPQLAALLRDMLKPAPDGEVTPEARELQEQIEQLAITDADGKPVLLDLHQPIKILADPIQAGQSGANQLIFFSSTNNLAALAAITQLMDKVPVIEGLSVQVTRLRQADAAAVAQTLTTIFQQSQRLLTGPSENAQPNNVSGKALLQPLNIATDPRSNSIILSGRPETLALATGLIDDLDQDLNGLITEVRIFPLKHASPSQLAPILSSVFAESNPVPGTEGLNTQVTRLRTLLNLEPHTTERAKTRAALTIQPDESSQALIVAARSDVMPLIEDLIHGMDISTGSSRDTIRIYPLNHASAAALRQVLNDLFNAPARTTQGRPADKPNITVDERTNALIISGNETAFGIVTGLIEKLDRKSDNPALELTVLPVVFNDATRIADMIENLFSARLQSVTPPGQKASPQDAVHVEADPLSNTLVISAHPDNLEIIRGLLAKVDLEPTAEGGRIQAFTLKHTDAQRAASMLRSLIDQGLYRPGVTAGQRRSPRESLAITVDSRSNTLIISASPENLRVVEELLNQIDTPRLAEDAAVQLFHLKHAKASHLASVLEQFFRAKRAGEALADDADAPLPVTITADDRTNTLLVTGGRDSFAVIERMIQQLDIEHVASKSTFRVFPLKHSTAAKVQSMLQRLFTNRPAQIRGQPSDPVNIVSDSWANALIISASNEDLALIESLIQQIDVDDSKSEVHVQVLPLSKADARQVAQTVEELYRDRTTAGSSSPVTVNVDERLNALIVSAGATDLKRITELVAQLDTDTVARVAEIRVFPLQHARAAELATILSSVLNTKLDPLTEASPSRQSLLQFITRSEEGKQFVASALKEGVLITADPRTNSLIVSAPADYMHLLEQIIARLDASSPQLAQIKVFPLRHADARQMALVLSSLFRLTQTGGTAPNQRSIQYTLIHPASPDGTTPVASAVLGTAEQNALTVTVDLRTNSLLVGGTEHYVSLVSEIIQALDDSPAQERQNEVYRLKNSRAEEVGQALRLFLEADQQQVTDVLGQAAIGTAQRVLEREVVIVPEPVSNTLLISASPRYFTQVHDLIADLDRPQQQVLIQVLLAEVTLDSTSDLGVEWSFSGTVNGARLNTATRFGEAETLRTAGGFSSAITGSNINFLLRALQNDGRLEVLSRPQILTADNQEANINIGRRVPLITDSRVTERGDMINQFTYENVGVELTVIPRISPDGFVKMDIGPSISQLSSSTIAISPGFSVPIINQRRATTTVSVQSGQSIIIGGLISTSDDERVKKVPFFGDLPYVGALFRSSRTLSERKELLIILTPQVLVKLEEPGSVTDSKSMTRQQLEHSTIKDEIHRDTLQKQILDPLLPEFYQERELPGPKQNPQKDDSL